MKTMASKYNRSIMKSPQRIPLFRFGPISARLLWLLTLGLMLGTAHATTAAWVGPTSDNLWGSAANWGGAGPAAGDEAIFPALGGIRSVDLAGGQQINSVQFNSASPDTYLVYNGSLAVGSGIDQAGSAEGRFNCAVGFGAAVTLSGAGSGNVYLQGGLSGSPYITMSGGNYWWSGVSGFYPAGLNLSGGYLHLSGTNQVSFGGSVQIQSGGSLCVQGAFPSAVSAASWDVLAGGTLKVNGSISGPVNVAGGTFAAGCSPGVADVQGDMFFDVFGAAEFELGSPNIVGNGNDWVAVAGSLTLDGTLNIVALPGFGVGTYRLFDCAGGVADKGVRLGRVPNGFGCELDFATAGQVNLRVSAAPIKSYGVTMPAGMGLIANQLDHGSNTLSEIMSNVPNGSVVSKYDGASGTWVQSTYSATAGAWSVPELTLSPGEGACFQSPTSCTLTFTGTPHVPGLPLSLAAGATYLVSRQTNDVGTYENMVGLSPADGTRVYKWTGTGYQVFVFEAAVGDWSPSVPSAAVGEAWWIGPAGAVSPPGVPLRYTLNLPAGQSLIANQLDHGSNTLDEVLPSVPDGTALYKRNNGGTGGSWTIATFSAATGSWLNGGAITLSPGEGAFLDSPSAFALTFTGQPHVPVLPVSIPAGQAYLVSRQTNDGGTYESIVGRSPPDGALVYQWNGSGYVVAMADSASATGWSDAAGINPVPEPIVAVGGALWIAPSGAGSPAPRPVAQGLTVIAPAAGSALCAGSPMTITWSGGAPTWNVLIYLVDVPSWTVHSTITPSTPNNGSFVWNIPPGLPASTYLVYIQEVSALTWTYGGNFAIGPCPTNACVPAPAGLGLWLPFDETSGIGSANLFPGGSPGTRMNGPAVSSGYVANSLSFNGANQFVTVPDYPAIDPGAGQNFSLDAWVKRAANAPDSLPSIIVDKRDPNTGVGYSLALSYGNLIFQMNAGSGGYSNYRDSGTIPPDDKWHLVAVTIIRNQTNGGQFYIDGVPKATFDPTAYPGSLASSAPFQVAASPVGGNRPWLGAIDEVEYFQRALLATEVQAIYLAGAAGKCKCVTPPANLSLWLPLDEATGVTAANLAPGGSSGTHVNGPVVSAGYVANSLTFNGVNQYVSVPDYAAIDPLAGQNFSLDAWVKRAVTSPNSPPSIIVDKRDPNTGVGYSLALSYGNLIWQMNAGSGYANYRDTGVIPPDNKWHLVAVTICRNQTNGGRFYIDGNATGSFDPTPYAGSLATTAPFQVGAAQLGGNQPWLGAIDEVEYFQRALTATEVLSIYNAGAVGKCKQGCGSALVLACANNQTVECGSAWKFTAPTATEAGCSNVTVAILGTVTNASPQKPCWQEVTRTWRATDCCGHSNTCSQTITIADTVPPVVTCSPSFATDCSLPWSFTPPTAVDACSGTNGTITVLSTTTNGHCPYSISRVWQVSDTCGNSTTCTQTVVVGDFTPPTISCIAGKTVECGSEWDFDRPAAFDACGWAVTVTELSTVTNGTACAQVITRTWVATNPCGYTNMCSQTVTTRDTTPPVFGLPGDKTIACGTPWVFDPPQVIDACCGQNVTLAVLSTVTNGTAPCSLVATRTWRATDCCGNSATNQQTVTVTDTTPPVFATSCVTNVFFAGGSNNFSTPVASSPSADLLARLHAAGLTQFKGFDDCSVNTYFAHTFTNLPHCITAATLKVRLKPCGDLCYNDAISLSFTSAGGVLQTNGSWGSYLGAGNPTAGLAADDWCNHTSGQTFVLNLAALPNTGANLLAQLNANGYLDFTSQDDSGVDYLELTVVSCCYQPTKTVECGNQWTFDPPTATDACCGNNVTIGVFSTVSNGVCPKVATRTWKATDCCGNSSFFSQVVTMIDTTPPTVYCPGPITRYVCTSSARVYYYVYAYDACSGYRPVTGTPASGSVFPLGTTVVTCTATDACGNVGTGSFTVTVVNQTITAGVMLGLPDCFKLPTESAPKSAQLLATYPGFCWRPFDYLGVNCAFGATFMNLPANLTCGQLWVRMKPNCGDNPENDGIALGLTATNTWGWSGYIGGGNAGPGLTQNTWCDTPGCGQLFNLNLASMPNTGANLLPLINAAGSHKLDLFVQDDTGVDFAYLTYCYCRTLPWWQGWDWTTANAGLANGQGFASFSPLWEPGYATNYAITLTPGATHGIQLGLVPLNLGALANATLTVTAATTLDPNPSAITLTGDGSNTVRIALAAVRANVTQVQLVFRLAGTVVFQETLPATLGSNLVSVTGGAALRALTVTETRELTGTAMQLAISLAGAFECPLCPPMVADELDVILLHPDAADAPENYLASLTLAANGLPAIQLSSAAVAVGGLYPQVTGEAVAAAGGDQLTITPLNGHAPGTPVGYQIPVPASQGSQAGFGLQVAQNLNGTTASNGVVEVVFTGQVGAEVVPAISCTGTQGIDGWALSADFAALGTTSLRVAIKQQGIRIAEVSWTGRPQVPVLPTTWVVTADPAAPSVRLSWPEAQTITLGGANYSGDELQITAGSPDLAFSTITAMEVQASGIDALTLSPATAAAEPVWVLQPPVIGPSQMTLQWAGPAGGILKSAPTLLGPWTPVSGQSGNSAVVPSPVTSGTARQFFRVQGN